MNRIFISYKRADKDLVFPLKDKIEAATGERCWIDLECIESDAQFVNIIMRAIDQADLFLFMFSQNHARIENFETDWTVREISYAQKKKKRIVIVNLDQTPMNDWFDFMFGLKQQVDATSEQAVERLTQDICRWLDITPPKPKPKKEPEKIIEKVVEQKVVYVPANDTYMPLGVAVVRGLRKYKTFRGRATRSEFWWWILFREVVLLNVMAIFLCFGLGTSAFDEVFGLLWMLVWLLLLLPTAAVWVRRCHDLNMSGWWALCPVYDIVLALMDGQREANTYGEVEHVDIRNESPLWQKAQRYWIPFVVGILSVLWLVLIIEYGTNAEEVDDEQTVEQVTDDSPAANVLNYDLYLEGTMVDPAELIYSASKREGKYYVDRKGRRVTRDVRLWSYDAQTGELLLEAYADSVYTGRFVGELTISGDHAMYTGTFTNTSGGSIRFNLSGSATQGNNYETEAE